MYFNFLKKNKLYHSPKSLKWYYDKFLFKNIDFKNKTVLDIGGGSGLISFYALYKGASKVVLIEPELDGSGSVKINNFYQIKNGLNFSSEKIELKQITIQEFDNEDVLFDIVISHNSINHLNEDACIRFENDSESRAIYKNIFFDIYNKMSPNSRFIITDCGRKNFFNDIKLKSPLAWSIEWEKHHQPETWAKLLLEVGFVNPIIQWASFKQLRGFGKIFFGNKYFAYLIGNLFKLEVKKTKLCS